MHTPQVNASTRMFMASIVHEGPKPEPTALVEWVKGVQGNREENNSA